MELFIIVFAVFGAIGFLSIITALTILFSSFGKNVSSIKTNDPIPAVSETQFLTNVSTASGGSTFRFEESSCVVLKENQQYQEQLFSDINEATESISIMTYIWSYDDSSEEMFSLLKSAVDRGVTVRLILDAHGSSINNKQIAQLESAGIAVIKFRPFALGKLTLYYARTHRRAYIFDGQTAYFGGSAISKRWFKNTLPDDFTYIDIMYRVTGEAVKPIASAFGEIWSTYASDLAQNLYYEAPGVQLPANAFALNHIPRNDVHPLTSALWYACAAARKEIFIVTPYFVPGEALTHILCQQARNGVAIIIITQGTNESRYVRYAARSYYDELLAAGATIYEHKRPHLHTKVLVIDNHFSVVGSANFDIRSQRINHELVIGVQSRQFAEQNRHLETAYSADLKAITTESRSQEPFYKKIIERLAHLVSEQF